MIDMPDDPEPIEEKVIRRALIWMRNVVKDAKNEPAFQLRMRALELDLFAHLPQHRMQHLIEEMIIINDDRQYKYQLNDYHMFILYRAIEHSTTAHNNAVLQGGEPVLLDSGKRTVDPSQFYDLIFWHTHFLFEADEFAELDDEKKQELGISEHIFSIANKLAPAEQELDLKRVKKIRPAKVGRL